MSVAHPEHWQACLRGGAQPVRGALTPVQALGDHRTGAGNHRCVDLLQRRQPFVRIHSHHRDFLIRQTQPALEPDREIAMTRVQGRQRGAGLHDQDFHYSTGGNTPTTSAIVVTPRATCAAALTRNGRKPSARAVSLNFCRSIFGKIIARTFGEMRIIS